MNQFSRTELLFGSSNMEKLKNSTVAIFGVGGVGGYVCEALARSGVYNFVLVDDDNVSITNINRQIIATLDTVGMDKCTVMKNRILSINKDANVEIHKVFYMPETKDQFDFTKFDYVVDAVDTVTAKLLIITEAINNNIPIISAMGAGNKINPDMLRVSDIYKTKVDPLASVMRKELKKRRVKKLKVVFSLEKPLKPNSDIILDDKNDLSTRSGKSNKVTPGSTSFVPSAMGLIIASEVVKDITGMKNEGLGA